MEGGLPVLSRLVRPSSGRLGGSAGIDPDRRNAVLLIAGIALIVVIALGLIAYGYYVERVEPRQENVLRVGDRHFSYAFLERRVKSDIAQGIFDTSKLEESIAQTVGRIQREELIRVLARERGITATDDEMLAALRGELGLDPGVSRNELAGILRSEVQRVNLPLDEYLETIEAMVLQDKIEAGIAGGIPSQAEQVNLLLIRAGTQVFAVRAKQALDDGTPFEEVARTYSQDRTASEGGVFGWAPRELLEPELADIAFNMTGRSDIIETPQDFYIVEVLGKEVREVSDDTRSEIGSAGFTRLLEQAQKEEAFAYRLTREQLVRLAGEVGALSRG